MPAPAPTAVPVIEPHGIYNAEDIARVLKVTPGAARKIMRKRSAVLRPVKIGRVYYVLGSSLLALFKGRARKVSA